MRRRKTTRAKPLTNRVEGGRWVEVRRNGCQIAVVTTPPTHIPLPRILHPPFHAGTDREGHLVKRMHLEVLVFPLAVAGVPFIAFIALYPFDTVLWVKKGVDMLSPSLPLLVHQMEPAHLAGDDLITLRIIAVALQQLHVPLRLPILLLQEPLPVVLVPDLVRILVVGHGHDQ